MSVLTVRPCSGIRSVCVPMRGSAPLCAQPIASCYAVCHAVISVRLRGDTEWVSRAGSEALHRGGEQVRSRESWGC